MCSYLNVFPAVQLNTTFHVSAPWPARHRTKHFPWTFTIMQLGGRCDHVCCSSNGESAAFVPLIPEKLWENRGGSSRRSQQDVTESECVHKKPMQILLLYEWNWPSGCRSWRLARAHEAAGRTSADLLFVIRGGGKSTYVDRGCCFSACFRRDRLWGCWEKKRTVGGQQEKDLLIKLQHRLTTAPEHRGGEPRPLLQSKLLLTFSPSPQQPQQNISSASFLQCQRPRLSHSSASNHLTGDSLHHSWVAGAHKRCRVNTLDRQIQAARFKFYNV